MRRVSGQVPPRTRLCLGISCTGVLGHRSRFCLWLVVFRRVELKFSQWLAVVGQDPDV